MTNWIYLSKKGDDEYMDLLAQGAGAHPTELETWQYESSTDPLVLRGIMKHKIIKQCWQDGRRFRYMDSGYLGNRPSYRNPHGWKHWHRIVPNNLQHGAVIKRPSDRWNQLGLEVANRRSGSHILIVAPDEKPCRFYGVDKETWVKQTVESIKQYTDRPVEVRERAPKRIDRIANDTLQQALDNDVFALVTFNSVAAIESIFYGIPAFTLAPNAASPVSLQDLSKINEPYYADSDKLHAWACHLAYGQFHTNELKSGQAKEMLLNG